MSQKTTPPKGGLPRPSLVPDPASSVFSVAEIGRYEAGELVDIDPRESRLYLVKQGAVTKELIIATAQGMQTIPHVTIEKGQYFNPHGFAARAQNEMSARVQFRASQDTLIFKIPAQIFLSKPDLLRGAFISFVRTAVDMEWASDSMLASAHAERMARNPISEPAAPPQGTSYRQAGQPTNVEVLGLELARLQTANAAMTRDLSQARKELEAANGKVQQLEAEARKKTASDDAMSERFPTASRVLLNEERQALEEATQDHRRRVILLQRAVEALRQANPTMVVPSSVEHLLQGAEPAPATNPVDETINRLLENFIFPEVPPTSRKAAPTSQEASLLPASGQRPSSETPPTTPSDAPSAGPSSPHVEIPRPSAVPWELRSEQAITSAGLYSQVVSDRPGRPQRSDGLPDFSAGDSDLRELLEDIRRNPFSRSDAHLAGPHGQATDAEASTMRSHGHSTLPVANRPPFRPPMETIGFDEAFAQPDNRTKDGLAPSCPPSPPRRK